MEFNPNVPDFDEDEVPPLPFRLRRADAGGRYCFINRRKYYIEGRDANYNDQVRIDGMLLPLTGPQNQETVTINDVPTPVLSDPPADLIQDGGRRRSRRRKSRKSKRSRRSRRV